MTPSRAAREFSLPLETLVINSDFDRPGGIHVIEYSAYDELRKQCAEIREAAANYPKMLDQALDERDELREENERLKKLAQSRRKEFDEYRATIGQKVLDATEENEKLKNQVAVLSYRAPSEIMKENERLKEAHAYLSTVDKRAIGDIMIENQRLRAALEKVEDAHICEAIENGKGSICKVCAVIVPALAAIKKRLEAATPGPWETVDDARGVRCKSASRRDPIWKDWIAKVASFPLVGQQEANAELIAHAPEDLRRLIEVVEVYEKALKKIEDALYVCDDRCFEKASEALQSAREILGGGMKEIEDFLIDRFTQFITESNLNCIAENQTLKAQLASAREVIEFYGNKESHVKYVKYTNISHPMRPQSTAVEDDKGKRARAWLKANGMGGEEK